MIDHVKVAAIKGLNALAIRVFDNETFQGIVGVSPLIKKHDGCIPAAGVGFGRGFETKARLVVGIGRFVEVAINAIQHFYSAF